jgi:hypothetical protein
MDILPKVSRDAIARLFPDLKPSTSLIANIELALNQCRRTL